MTTFRRPTDNAFTGSLKPGESEPTYGGALSFMRRRYSRELKGADVVVWGVPFDAATSNRPGARFGPRAMRAASTILDTDPQYPFGIDLFEQLNVIDWGDCGLDYGKPETVAKEIETQASAIIASDAALVTLGGDHFCTLPLLRAHAKKHGPLALVQFDAHQDTWHPEGEGRIDHGSFVSVAVKEKLIDPAHSIQIGIRTHAPEDFGIAMVSGYEVPVLEIGGVIRRIRERVGNKPAYLTFDIDALDPAHAPGTGTPVAGGLSTREALMILSSLEDVNFKGFDVMEVSPPYDHAEITAIAGATVAMNMIGLIALRRMQGGK
jgi:agmatinase